MEINSFNYKTSIASTDCSEEIARFKELQRDFAPQFELVFPDTMAAKTVVVIPSLSLDQQILQKVEGSMHYEERMLCLLMLLRMPHTSIIYVTSTEVDSVILDYYLHLLPGITGYHARQRIKFFSCYDSSSKSLTEKILERPRLINRIRKAIPAGDLAHMACFNVTEAERKLSVQLNIPIFGCDPDLLYLGSKSNGRKLFKIAGLHVAEGYEDLNTIDEIVIALAQLKLKIPLLSKAVIKINEGFSGEGNAIFNFKGSPSENELYQWVYEQLPKRLYIIAVALSYEDFMAKFNSLGGVVEAFIDGLQKQSPSVQCRINPLGKIDIISTHDQVLGGNSSQVFLGATFPASHHYSVEIAALANRVSEELKWHGVLGRFSVDFISVKVGEEWQHYAVEINLRKGGTTHPYLMLQFLTDGKYDAEKGLYFTANGLPRYYVCSDTVQQERYKGLTPHDLMEIAICNGLLYDSCRQEGVMFHLISALSQFGKLGLVCIGSTLHRAKMLYKKTIEVLDKETINEATNNY